MDIVINGQQLEFSLENEKNIGDVLQAIETDCEASNATIIRICTDGHLVTEDDFESTCKKSLDSVQKLQLETMSEKDVILFIENTSTALEEIITQLLQVPVLLQSNKDGEVSTIVMNFVDKLDSIQHISYFCSLFPNRFDDLRIENTNISGFLQELTPILQEFEDSLASHDTVLTGDLAEYEIVPKLQAFVNATTAYLGAPC